MSIKVNPIRKEKVKQAKLKGKSDKACLLEAGYSRATAEHHASKMSVLDCVEKEILQEMRASNVSVDGIVRNLYEDRMLAEKKMDIATMARCDELLGKFLAMFTDKQEVSTLEKQENQFSLNRLAQIRQEEKQ